MRPASCIKVLLLTGVLLVASLRPLVAQVSVSDVGGIAVVSGGDAVDRSITLQNNGGQAVSYRIAFQQFSPGDRNDRSPRRDDRGGPDDFEMEWRDSNEEDGPTFEWIDISDLDETVDIEANDDDSLYGMFDIGFNFPFYGEEYDQFSVHGNGYICFLPVFRQTPYYNAWPELPIGQSGDESNSPPPTMLGVNFQDLNVAVRGRILYWTDGSVMVVTWEDVPHFFGDNHVGDTWTFQVILTEDGFIKFQYHDVGDYDDARDLNIGIQNEDCDRGFNVAIDTDQYLEDEMAIGFGPPSAWINWVVADPPNGQINAGAEQEINLSFNPAEIEAGSYWANLILSLDNGQPRVSIPITLSYDFPVGSIGGQITDAAENVAVEGAYIELTDVGMFTWSDENGNFEFDNLPIRDYQLFVSAESFNDFDFGAIAVEAGDEADGSVALLHGEFTPNRDRVTEQTPPDTDIRTRFTIENGGNADVQFTSDRRLIGDANTPPWQVRRTFELTETLGDERIEGAIFVEDHFYVAGAGANPNQIYKLDRDGELVDQFTQAGTANFGMRDLEWDGEWIWGSGEDTVYAFTTEGEVMRRFRGPIAPNSIFAYDSDREQIWIGATTSNFVRIDRDGNVIGQAVNRRNLRMYGRYLTWECTT